MLSDVVVGACVGAIAGPKSFQISFKDLGGFITSFRWYEGVSRGIYERFEVFSKVSGECRWASEVYRRKTLKTYVKVYVNNKNYS